MLARLCSIDRCRVVVALALLFLAARPALAAVPDPQSAGIGRVVDDFQLPDARGAQRKLSDLTAGHDVVVVVFLGTECPMARLYAPLLSRMAGEYGKRRVAFLAVDSNRQDSLVEMLHYARVYDLTIPFLRDGGNAVADLFAAERTPEVFVLDRERKIRYRGRIDDRYGVGTQRDHAASQELRAALDALLAGREVVVPVTQAPGCRIGRVRPVSAAPTVTWSRQISRLFQQRCQECHRPGQIGPFPLLTYDDVAGWSEMIGEVVEQRRMPPWHASPEYGDWIGEARLSDEELELVRAWVDQGAPEGDPAELPPPRKFVEGWQIPNPDQVVYMSDRPFTVPAEGAVEYQWFVADPHFTEDKWIQAAEARPGNPAVVHHVTVYFKPPGLMTWKLELNDRINVVAGYAPGKRPVEDVSWKGQALYVPAGSQFVFEMHYTSNGTAQPDRSSIALTFADPAQVKKQLSVVMVANTQFTIPPQEADYPVEASYVFDEDSLLYALSPHMHLRGKTFRFEAQYPDGAREILLDIPRFDFNWQTDYQMREPKRVPAGTKVFCTATFDNSAENLANPDPGQTVRWGDQTWEEMMIGGMAIAPADQDLAAGIGKPAMVINSRPSPARVALAAVAGLVGLGMLTGLLAWFVQRWRHPLVAASAS
ncbi:MAG: redoxin domain-containing protein [Pirellulales bacterium]|nr:redoxin domain-containing protein [Pirellulales bacterium]